MILNGDPAHPKIVKIGETVQLPPGRYAVFGAGEWAMGAIEQRKFEVKAGEPVTLELAWRKGIRLYVLHLDGAEGLHLVQVESAVAGKRFSVDMRVDDHGTALFWIRSRIETGIVRATGYAPVDVVFRQTADPDVATAECRLERAAGR